MGKTEANRNKQKTKKDDVQKGLRQRNTEMTQHGRKKPHPINKQNNKLEKRQCLQKLGESTIKWNTAETSPYPFLQLNLLQIVLKSNEIYFLSTECWLSLFRDEFCYWHVFK